MLNDENETPLLAEAGSENTSVSGKETNENYPPAEQKANDTCEPPKPNPEATVAFLRNAFGGEAVTLTAILSDPEKQPNNWPKRGAKTVTRTLLNESDVAKWAEGAAMGEVNVYFTPNVLEGSHDNKPKKTDIKAARWLHCDCDPRAGEDISEEQKRILSEIRNLKILPTVVVFTGGGYQCLWRLAPDVPVASDADIAAVEGRNIWLGKKFTLADNTHNIDRILRLPGTVNYPDERKKKKGRVAALAYVVEELTDWTRTYRLEDIPHEPMPSNPTPPTTTATTKPSVSDISPEAVESLEVLAKWKVPQAVCDVIASGKGENHPSRSEAVFYVACQLVRRNVPDAVTLGILLNPSFGISESVLEFKGKAEAYARRQVEQAKEATDTDIIVQDGDLIPILTKAEQSLMSANTPIYQRGEILARTVFLEKTTSDDGVRRSAGATILADVEPKWLVEQLARAGTWLKRNTKGDLLPTDPKEKYAQHLIGRKGEWPYRKLRAVTHTPTLRQDGSVLQTEGYDEASCLLYIPAGVNFAPIPDQPTREDAIAALATLKKPFSQFPFMGEASRSVILAAVLTGLIRPSVRTSPMFCLDAPTAGTGKSLLAEMVGLIVTGNVPAMMSQGKNEEEDEKRLSTVLRGGDPVIVVDNCESEVKGDFLCSMLTQELVQARILGKSEMVRLPNNSIVLATGNNLAIAGDMCRRVLICRIDANVERPDARQFTFDARQMVREQRPELVVAGLTILRAYIAAGKPNPLPKMGSFEEWGLIREALVWLGAGDPYETTKAALEHDPRKNELVELLAAWHACFKDKPITLAQIDHIRHSGKPHTEQLAILHRLLTELGGKTFFNAKSIGHKLRRHLERVVGGMVLRREEHAHGAKWSVVKAGDTKQATLPLGEQKE